MPHRPTARPPRRLMSGHQVLVHLAAEHLLDHVHGLVVGVAQAVHELGLLAHLLQHLVDLRPAAVDHHHMDAHQVTAERCRSITAWRSSSDTMALPPYLTTMVFPLNFWI